ncbi:hypothetical protein ACFROC_10060 [Nocardia tengchongensis]|uniref:hypothetical protein n=1 Tax=Nocardia tengchongensis TaxID=2055889 RepID=UPI0036892839
MTAPPSPPVRLSDLVYGLSTVGDGGRIVDRQVFAALAWSAGDRLSLRVDGAALVAEPTVDGAGVAAHITVQTGTYS